MVIARWLTSYILIPFYTTTHLSTFICNDIGDHQMQTNSQPNDTTCHSTTLSQSLWRGGNPYESLHAVMRCGVKPWFGVFVGVRGTGKEGDTNWVRYIPSYLSWKKGVDFQLGISMTKKKFVELELLLLHHQQNVKIPETHLIIHPVIQQTAEQATEQVKASPPTAFQPPH